MDIWLRRIAVFGMMGALLVVCFTIAIDVMRPISQVAAAWVQAVGTLVGLAVAIAAPEFHARKREQREHRRRAALLFAAADRSLTIAVAMRVWNKDLANRYEGRLNSLLQTLREFHAIDMPDGNLLAEFLLLREAVDEAIWACRNYLTSRNKAANVYMERAGRGLESSANAFKVKCSELLRLDS